jgi:hypothetical protein
MMNKNNEGIKVPFNFSTEYYTPRPSLNFSAPLTLEEASLL